MKNGGEKMNEFNVGDRIRRINGDPNLLSIGAIYTVKKCNRVGVYLEGQPSSYEPSYFELVKPCSVYDGKKKKEKPKKITTAVAWEESGCGDPVEFFTNPKDAKDFILNTLAEKTNIVNGSIRFIDIRSIKEVTIRKILGFKQVKMH